MITFYTLILVNNLTAVDVTVDVFLNKRVFLSLTWPVLKAYTFISNINTACSVRRQQLRSAEYLSDGFLLLIFQLNSWRYRTCFPFSGEKGKEALCLEIAASWLQFGTSLLRKVLACTFCSIYVSVNTIIHGCSGQLVSNYCSQLQSCRESAR